MADGRYWETWDFRRRAEFQLVTSELSMPFDVFHEALEKTLGRPVFTHELAMNAQGLYDELFNGKPSPSFEEICNLIPEDKRILIVI